ncbi:hypothetical protein H9C73_11500 [Marinobacterium sp. AK62]|uniref:NADH:quinone oxidoreductase/Mrp antiporter transmembrane domain-containing protein n=1 Tax=Marinobacterium alkalitolerans TaxID=1542925 RepID=A0ABS3ZEA5_9GAMM|nr:complex I subunit 5 family protein [Marinobacterium alkalitolerans]MBP0049364.1 hypothetical protein [Marinobacterium alkalitolerans]
MMVWVLLAVCLPLLPVVLALHPALQRWQWRLLPLVSLPALGLVLLGPAQWQLGLPGLLLGANWQLDALRQPFLLLTALLWSFAGLYATGYVKRCRRSFALFWGLTLCGNLGLVLAADLVSFYAFFALMTFAGYGLVVHERTSAAFRAGRVYLVMAVLGEMALLAGLLLAAGTANSLLLADLSVAIAESPRADLIMVFLLVGFGVKAGLLLLHLWLPLAHPVAPTPASAVLSGAMIKAGLLGWLLTLPLGQTSQLVTGTVLVLIGMLASLGGALIGVCQRQSKAVLAYSSISQMGLMTLMLGVALAVPERTVWLLPVIGTFALHHALAKGALFLSVGIRMPNHRLARWLYWGVIAVPGLSLAGLPLTSGAHTKLAMKQALQVDGLVWSLAPWLGNLLTAGAMATLLLVLRFLWLQVRNTNRNESGPCMQMGWGLVLMASLLFPWFAPELPAAITTTLADHVTYWMALIWPMLVALFMAGMVVAIRLRAPEVPAGDLVVLLEDSVKKARGRSRVSVSIRIGGKRVEWLQKALVCRVQPAETGLRVHIAGSVLILALLFFLL